MTRFLLDMNTAAHCIFKRHGIHERVVLARAQGHRIGIAMPVLAELSAGVEGSSSRASNLQILNGNLKMLKVWPFTEDAAREYGRLYVQTRAVGRPMQAIDLMIAAIVVTFGDCVLVTTDSDFEALSQIKKENWVPSRA